MNKLCGRVELRNSPIGMGVDYTYQWCVLYKIWANPEMCSKCKERI